MLQVQVRVRRLQLADLHSLHTATAGLQAVLLRDMHPYQQVRQDTSV